MSLPALGIWGYSRMPKTVKITEPTWRKIERLLQEQQTPHTLSMPSFRSASIVRMRNDSGSAVVRFGILGISGSAFDPATELAAFQKQVVLSGVVPTAEAHSLGRFAICAEPIAAGRIGAALVAGISQVKVNVSDASALFADVYANDATRLKSVANGPCSILYKQPGTGDKWAIVKHGGVGAGDVEKIEWILLSNTSTHPMTGIVSRFNAGSGTWTNIAGAVSLYRYPTHTSNAMYKTGPGEMRVAASKVTSGVYIALHSVPREFELYGGV